MSILKKVWLVTLLAIAGVSEGAGIYPEPVLDGPNAPITLGQWHSSLAKGKAYAEEHDVPMLYIWGDDGCSYCDKMDGNVALSVFKEWQAERKLVMVFVQAPDNSSSPEKNFAKYGLNGTLSKYPFLAVYWPSKNSKPYNFTGQYTDVTTPSVAAAQKTINLIEKHISEYVSGPLSIKGGAAVDENSSVQLSAVFKLNNNPEINVTSTALWSTDNTIANVNNGLLAAGEVNSLRKVNVTVQYSANNKTYIATQAVSVKNVLAPGVKPSAFEIIGPSTVSRSTPVQYRSMLYFDDGVSFEDVTINTAWNEKSVWADLSKSGLLTPQSYITKDMTVTLNAAYTYPGGATFDRAKNVLILVSGVPEPEPDPEPVVPPAVDAWDPADDARVGATTLNSSSPVTHGPHYLNLNDVSDWFKVTNVESGKQYRVTISNFSQKNSANLRAEFFIGASASTWTNLPLTALQTGITYTAASAADLLINTARDVNTNATVMYTMNVSEWVPCTLSFTDAAMTVNAGQGTVNVVIERSGEATATSATVTMINGSALAGQDFNGTPVTVNWTAGGSNQRSASIPVIKDQTWEADEEFTLILTPNPLNAIPGAITEKVVTIRSNVAVASGTLALTGYGPNKTAISTLGIPASEGQTIRLWAARTGGSDTAVSAQFTWSSGGAGFEVAPVLWQHGAGGEKYLDVTVPLVEGYQGKVAVTLTMSSPETTVNTRANRVKFNVSDSEYGASVSTYVGQNKEIPFSSRNDQWFYPADAAGAKVLRSATPATAGSSSVLTASLTGPGVLSFDAAILNAAVTAAGGGRFTLAVGYQGTPVEIAAENAGPLAFVIPAGRQTVTLSFTRTAETVNGDFALISDINYVKLDAIGLVAPLQGAVVVEGTQTLVWNNALLPLAGIAGLEAAYAVYAGPTALSMSKVAQIGIDGQPLALTALPETVSTDIAVTPGMVYWRVDVQLDTGTAVMNVQGKAAAFEVVADTAPQFAVDSSEFNPRWFESITADGSTVNVKLMIGMNSAVGPFGLAAGGTDRSVRAVSGRLPTGVTAVIEEGQLYLKGTPTRTGAGSAILRLSERQAGVLVNGTTIAVLYNVLPLPAKAYGTFAGIALINNPLTGIETPATANITIRNTGAATGRLTTPSGVYSFRTAGFDGDDYYAEGYFVQRAVVTQGTAQLEISMLIDVPGESGTLGTLKHAPQAGSPLMFVQTQLTVADVAGATAESVLARNSWRDRPLDPLLAEAATWLEGYYTVSIPGATDRGSPSSLAALPESDEIYGNGYLTLTVARTGTVRISGKLADGERVSASAVLVATEDGAYCEFMTAPRSYAGGFFMGLLEFVSDEVLLLSAGPGFSGTPLIRLSGTWVNFNPQATAEQGAGFERSFERQIAGGYYSRTQNLYQHFADAELGFETCYDYWECANIELLVNSTGSGFVVPRGGTALNPVYLAMRATLSTGVVTLGFRKYAEGSSTSYTTLAGGGILTPYFQSVPELAEISLRAYVLERKRNETAGYYYNESTPFALNPNCGGCGD